MGLLLPESTLERGRAAQLGERGVCSGQGLRLLGPKEAGVLGLFGLKEEGAGNSRILSKRSLGQGLQVELGLGAGRGAGS